jgi:P4 family phage/plasmid primase-like protien
MNIPEQLKDCRFIKTNNDKRPSEKDWPRTANYSHKQFHTNNSTYGVLCGKNRLIVIDCDTQSVQDKLLTIPEIRETFTVKTANKKLYHFYLQTEIENPEGFRLDNDKGERIADVQGKGTQVIGPNSTIDNIGTYEIVNPRPIATIPYEMLKTIMLNIEDNIKTITKADKKEETFEFDEVCKGIKDKIPINTFLKNKTQNPTKCPLGHTSEGGQSFHHTGKVWYCHHCHKTGNVIQLYMSLHNTNFQTAKARLAEKAGLINEIERKILQLYSDQKTRDQASELLATEFLKLNKVHTVRTDKDPEMWIYRGGLYIPEGRTYIKEYVSKILRYNYKLHFANQIIEKIIVKTYIEPARLFAPENLDKVPVQNGILDIKKKTLEPFTDKYRFFNKLPVIYDPIIQPTIIEDFFNEILVDKQDKQVIQELFGYLLYRDYRYEKAWMFLGKGRNGKGKTIELMERFLGKDNCASIDLQTLSTSKFSSGNLFNKMANLAGDLDKKGLENTALFKKLTGHDLIDADRKFLTNISFRNHAKMVFAANELPYTYDDSEGFYDRWIMIDFPFKFVPKPTEKHHRLIDTQKIEKISTDKELSGLLNWALIGLQRLLDNNRFSTSTTTEDVRRNWKRQSSSMSAFLMDKIETRYEKGVYITIADFEKAYLNYCQEHKIKPENKKSIMFKINELGASDSVKKIGGVNKKVYNWIRLKDRPEEEEITVGDLE